MTAAVVAGMLLLCLLLLMMTISEILPTQETEQGEVYTVLLITGADSVSSVRRRLHDLAWCECSAVGAIILLLHDCDDPVRDYCTQVSRRRKEVFLCAPGELESFLDRRRPLL